MSTGSSHLFVGYRALGFVSNQIPFCVRFHPDHNENYVTTCVGRAFHVYAASDLGIKSISDTLPEPIQCLKVDDRHVYASAGNRIYAFMQLKKIVHTYVGHRSPVHLLLPFVHHLIAVDESNYVKIWNIDTEDVFSEIPFDKETFEVTALIHPPTYTNKILFGSRQGKMQLYNIRTDTLLYTFSGWNSNITVLEESTAQHVVAVGLGDGRIILHNIQEDVTILKFMQDWGAVTAISFRTDDMNIMVSGSQDGHVAVWNLLEKRLVSEKRDVHDGPVTSLKCLLQQPIVMTSSVDNSVKRWIFGGLGKGVQVNSTMEAGLELHGQRCGHRDAVMKVRFHGGDGNMVLSSGADGTLQQFSTVHDSGNRSLGRVNQEKSGLKKENIITNFVSETARQSDWDGILAIHQWEKVATTWNYNRKSLGEHKLTHNTSSKDSNSRLCPVTATCIAVTSCGNFGLVGYSSGHVSKFNMQSGKLRGSYGKTIAPLYKAHDGPVVGICVDLTNHLTMTIGKDSCLKFWSFSKKSLEAKLNLESVPTMSVLHRESELLAVACDDFSIIIVDVRTKRVVRRFTEPTNSITDMAFWSDGRKLTVSSKDSAVRTWDVLSSKLIDCFLVESPVVSLSISPTDNLLVTAHVGDPGLYLWSNKTFYTGITPTSYSSVQHPSLMMCPGTNANTDLLEEIDEVAKSSAYQSPAQLGNLLTFSDVSKNKWLGLYHLDIIKKRNKTKEQPKVAKGAPFFLPSVPGFETKLALPDEDDASSKVQSKEIVGALPLSKFGRLVQRAGDETEEAARNTLYTMILEALKKVSPSAVETEFRNLSPDYGGSIDLLISLFDFFDHFMQSECNLMWTYMATAMKLHRDLISVEPELLSKVSEVVSRRRAVVEKCKDRKNKILCLTRYNRDALL